MRVVLLASGAFALPTLRWLNQSPHQLPLVITQPARPRGRGRKVAATPTQELAQQLGLNVLEADNVNAAEVMAAIRATDARLGLVIAFGQKLGPELLGSLPAGFVNLHASLLPKYRGAAPIQWAIIRGEAQTGCTVFRIVDRMDAGPILTTRSTLIKPEESAGELHDRLAGIGVDAVRAALPLFDGGAIPDGATQDERQATTAPKLKKRDGFIRFDRSAEAVVRHIRGMTPWPGATALFRSSDGRCEHVTVVRARRAAGPSGTTDPPGRVDVRRHVAAADGFVELLEVRPASGRIMPWSDFVNGRHVAQGDRFVLPNA